VEVELTAFAHRADAQCTIQALGIEPEGARRLAYKAILRPVVVRGVRGGAANLLKQEMLARGGDTAVPSRAVMHPDELVDVCLLGTLQDYKSLLRYLRSTPIFHLPELADKLQALLGEELD
jgi:dihydropteroate synthase